MKSLRIYLGYDCVFVAFFLWCTNVYADTGALIILYTNEGENVMECYSTRRRKKMKFMKLKSSGNRDSIPISQKRNQEQNRLIETYALTATENSSTEKYQQLQLALRKN